MRLHFFLRLQNLIKLLKTVNNPLEGIYIRLGLISSLLHKLRLRDGQAILVRPAENDIHEVISVLSGSEYPFRLYKHLLKKRPVIFDIGAYIGEFEIYIKKKVSTGVIYAFEPHPANFSLLTKNIAMNKLKHVYAIKKAVSNRISNGYLATRKETIKNEAYLSKKGNIKVKTITLDSFVKNKRIMKIDLLKLDCEGEEYNILSSFRKIFMCRSIILEYHTKKRKKMPQHLKKLLMKNFDLQYEKKNRKMQTGILFFVNRKVSTASS